MKTYPDSQNLSRFISNGVIFVPSLASVILIEAHLHLSSLLNNLLTCLTIIVTAQIKVTISETADYRDR